MNIERVNVLGVQISAINMRIAVNEIEGWIEGSEKNYICVTPAHSVMDCYTSPDLYPIFNHSGLTTPDGMSIAWLLKLKGYHYVKRVAGADLFDAVMHYSEHRGWRHYLYGGNSGTPEKLASQLTSKYPDLKIVGVFSPPFRELKVYEEAQIIDKINATGPDIVWVGISSPRQERWMSRNIQKLSASVLIGVGAAFDYLSGEKKRAPSWMQNAGMEWLYRFAMEPRRLWPRYRQYPLFMGLSLAQILGIWKN